MAKKSFDYERHLEARQNRRMANEARWLDRRLSLEKKAERMIGELCRDGKIVYYVYPENGRYKESNSFTEIVDYLIRNKYVR